MNEKSALILGYGVVGKATHAVIMKQDWDVTIWDPALGYKPELARYDVILVCTPCPDGNLDVYELLSRVDTKDIVIRSTILPHVCDDLSRDLNTDREVHIGIYHWPEFLTEATAAYDALHPDKRIMGTSENNWKNWQFTYSLTGNDVEIVSSRASAIAKLAINNYYALKVIMNNIIFDMTDRDEKIYEEVMIVIKQDKRITMTHTDITQDGYRGYGGKCLPKDMEIGKAAVLHDNGHIDFYDAAIQLNDNLVKGYNSEP